MKSQPVYRVVDDGYDRFYIVPASQLNAWNEYAEGRHAGTRGTDEVPPWAVGLDSPWAVPGTGTKRPKLKRNLRISILLASRDLTRLVGLDVVAIEEQTPAGWTRRVLSKGKRNFCYVYGLPFDNHEEMHSGANCTRRPPRKRVTCSA